MKNMMFAIVMLFAATPAFAQISDTQKLNELVLIRENIEMMDTLNARGITIDPSEIKEQLVTAGKLLDKDGPITYEELKAATGSLTPPPTPWKKFTGFFSFVNIVMILAALMLTLAIVWLFGFYFLGLILVVPPKVWEVISYIGCFGLIAFGSKAEPDLQMLWVLPGCFGLIGALTLNKFNWWRGERGRYSRYRYEEYFTHFATFVLAVAWGITAVYFQSQIVGFMAVGATLSFLGFMCGVIPGVVYIGFTDDAVVLRSTFAAFCMGAIYTAMHATGKSNAVFETFSVGLSWWGFFVFYLGMLIMSSKWYSYDGLGKYLLMQILTIVAGAAALYLGNVYQIGLLAGIGGTFFGLYLIEKWYEVPWKGAGWAWSLLGLSVFLYYFVGFAKLHPEYFLFVVN